MSDQTTFFLSKNDNVQREGRVSGPWRAASLLTPHPGAQGCPRGSRSSCHKTQFELVTPARACVPQEEGVRGRWSSAQGEAGWFWWQSHATCPGCAARGSWGEDRHRSSPDSGERGSGQVGSSQEPQELLPPISATSLAAAGGDSPSSPSSLLPDLPTALTGSLPKQLKASTEHKEGYLSSLKVSRTGIKSAPAEVEGSGGQVQGPSPGKQRLQWEHRPAESGLGTPACAHPLLCPCGWFQRPLGWWDHGGRRAATPQQSRLDRPFR